MSDKIIQFPGKAGKTPTSEEAPAAPAIPGMENLSEDQRKALQLIASGLPFVLIAMQPTARGADFFTALHGEPEDLRNAHPHLPGVIDRLYARKGLHIS